SRACTSRARPVGDLGAPTLPLSSIQEPFTASSATSALTLATPHKAGRPGQPRCGRSIDTEPPNERVSTVPFDVPTDEPLLDPATPDIDRDIEAPRGRRDRVPAVGVALGHGPVTRTIVRQPCGLGAPARPLHRPHVPRLGLARLHALGVELCGNLLVRLPLLH